MTPWERVLGDQSPRRRKEIARRTRWQDRPLDERTARAVAAVLNGPAPPRGVAGLAVESDAGWEVLVRRVGGAHEVERLRTLGDAAPLLGAAMRARWTSRRAGGPAPSAASREVRFEATGLLAPPGEAEGQVREALDQATAAASARRNCTGEAATTRRGAGS